MSKKLKIAVICENPHYILGGIENYNALCYQDWAHKYDVTEFPFIADQGKRSTVRPLNNNIKINYLLVGWKPNLMIWGGIYTKKKMQKIFNDFDVVIINSSWIPKKWLNNDKTILVQHNDLQVYCWKWNSKNYLFSFSLILNSLFFNIGTLKNPFLKAKNIVFYSKETDFESNVKNKWYIQLAHKSQSEIICQNINNRLGFAWIGRLVDDQKNVKDAIRLANLNNDMSIYGQGNVKLIDKYLKNKQQFKGIISKHQIDEILKSLKAFILTSKYEGFSFVVVEALSMGTPVIMFNTFDAAKFFKNSGAVFLIEKNNIEQFNAKIAWLRNLSLKEYENISNQAIDFAKKHFTKEIFWNKWDQVLSNWKTND